MAEGAAKFGPLTSIEVTSQPTVKVAWTALIAVFLAVYWPTLTALAHDWWTNPDYSHGFLVPLAIAYIVYERRTLLRSAPPAPCSGLGLITILLSQLMFLVGYLGAEYFLQRSAMVGLAAGVILFLAGWTYLRHLFLPLVLLELSFPLPAIVLNRVTISLQLVASAWAESILRTCGLVVYRSGNILQLGGQTLNVTEACSGIRSLACLVTLAVALTAFFHAHWIVRALFVSSTIGIAIVANAVRVSGTGLLGHFFGPGAATGFFHLFEGWLVFLAAFALLALELKLIRRLRSQERSASQ
jgi:exosortase